MIALNINGATSKLETLACLKLLNRYDIVILSEIRCNYPFSVPGFRCIRSATMPGEDTRGVAILFKLCIWSCVYSVFTTRDQVWFSLKGPDIRIGGVYIASSDSPYFSNQSFANIQEQTLEHQDIILLGDLNARIPNLNTLSKNINYS